MSATRSREATGAPAYRGEDGVRLACDAWRPSTSTRSRCCPFRATSPTRRSADAEQAYIETGSRWRRREGFHLFLHSAAPDAVGVAFNDSPAGLAAWLVEKYRRWSDCGGEVERRFSKDQLCDFLTMYWATGDDRLLDAALPRRAPRPLAARPRASGSRCPAAAADFPAEIVRPPREWAERIFSDLRRWTEMPRGGHFAAFEEPRAAGRRRDRVPGRRLTLWGQGRAASAGTPRGL